MGHDAAIRVGDSLRISTHLLLELHRLAAVPSHVVTVEQIRDEADGTKSVILCVRDTPAPGA